MVMEPFWGVVPCFKSLRGLGSKLKDGEGHAQTKAASQHPDRIDQPVLLQTFSLRYELPSCKNEMEVQKGP